MESSCGKWTTFKSKHFDKHYSNQTDIKYDMLALNLDLEQNFYTDFRKYQTSPFDYLPFKFEVKICKIKLGDEAYKFDFYRLGSQEFFWGDNVDYLPEHGIHYRGTTIETLVSIEKTSFN